MVMSRKQNAGRSHNIKTDNSSFEMVEDFKYLGTNLTRQSSIQEEIKSRKVRECLLSFGAESFVFQFAIHTLREERRLKMFENRVLRRIFGPKRDEVIGVEKTT